MLDRTSFSAHLRDLRTARGISQEVAARAAGVNPSTWWRWENGAMPELAKATAIARALAIPTLLLSEPNNGRIAVADLTINEETLERIRKGGTPELERVAASLAEQITARIATLAAAPLPQPPRRIARARPVAHSARSRLAARRRAQAARESAL
jgi:transcriptional regulator with XRE-family HTH domain